MVAASMYVQYIVMHTQELKFGWLLVSAVDRCSIFRVMLVERLELKVYS